MRMFVCLLCLVVFLPASAYAQSKEKPYLVLEAGWHHMEPFAAFFTADGKQFVTVSVDRTIRFVDAASGAQVKVLRTPMGLGAEGQLRAAALSPSGRYLAVGGLGFEDGSKYDCPIHVIDLQTDKIAHVFRGSTAGVTDLSFSGDGKRLAAVGNDTRIWIWDLDQKTLAAKVAWDLKKGADSAHKVALGPDGTQFVMAASKHMLFWDLKTGNKLQQTLICKDVQWSPDGKTIATAHADGVRLWNPDGSLIKRIDDSNCSAVAFDARSKTLVWTAPGLKKAKGSAAWNMYSGKTIATNQIQGNVVAVSPDGTTAATILSTVSLQRAEIWRTKDGIHLATADHKGLPRLGGGFNKLGWGRADKIFSVNTSPKKETGLGFDLSSLDFTSDVKDADYQGPVAQDGDWSLEHKATNIGVLKKGQLHRTIIPPTGHRFSSGLTLLNRDRAIALTDRGDLFAFDLQNGKLLAACRAHNGASGIFTKIAPSHNGRFVVSHGRTDRTLCVWDPKQKQPLFFLCVPAFPNVKSQGGEWIIWTPEGFYACSPGADRFFGWHLDRGRDQLAGFAPASQFRKSLYRPDVIERLLEFGSVEKALEAADKASGKKTAFRDASDLQAPVLALTTSATDAVVKQPKVSVEARLVKAGSQPVQKLELLLDGRPMGTATPPDGKPGAWNIDLPPGTHRLSVLVFTSVSMTRTDEIELTYLPPMAVDTRPALYVLSIGINDYPKEWKLNFAVNDARGIEKVFQAQKKKTFRDVDTRLLIDKNATREGIRTGLNWLQKTMQPQDVAVIFYAGHGMNKKGNFFLCPVDTNFNNVENTAIADDEIKRRLTDMPGRILVMFDACHSGATGARVDRLARDLSDEDCGVVVMCAATGREEAGEDRKLGHGYFAHAVIQGLSGKADTSRKDGQVYLGHLETYVYDTVVELSKDEQHPVVGRPTSVRTFALAKPGS